MVPSAETYGTHCSPSSGCRTHAWYMPNIYYAQTMNCYDNLGVARLQTSSCSKAVSLCAWLVHKLLNRQMCGNYHTFQAKYKINSSELRAINISMILIINVSRILCDTYYISTCGQQACGLQLDRFEHVSECVASRHNTKMLNTQVVYTYELSSRHRLYQII